MNQRITSDVPREFFKILPGMVDYMPLTPYEYRLYGHYIRVCGGSVEGECWESVRTTAKTCRISAGSVVKARQGLCKHGLILAWTDEDDPSDTVHVTLLDVWSINSEFLRILQQGEKLSIDEMDQWFVENTNRVFTTRTGCSPHEQGVHQVNVNRSNINRSNINRSNEIDPYAAAAGSFAPSSSLLVSEIGSTYEIGSRVEGTAECGDEELVHWSAVGESFPRSVVNDYAMARMQMIDWRGPEQYVASLNGKQLIHLLLWLTYCDRNYEKMSAEMDGDIRSIPAYIRSVINSVPMNSGRDRDSIVDQLRRLSFSNRHI